MVDHPNSGGDDFTFTAADATDVSVPATVTIDVDGAAPELTLRPVADSYVSASAPTASYGGLSSLRTDQSPARSTYLRFDVAGAGTIQSATLRINAETVNAIGFDVRPLADNTWTETSLTYANAPAPGAIAGSSPSIRDPGYVEVDVTSLVRGNGLVSFVLTSSSTRATRYSSRETASPPELVVRSSP